jgi:hypothetical protein
MYADDKWLACKDIMATLNVSFAAFAADMLTVGTTYRHWCWHRHLLLDLHTAKAETCQLWHS